MIITKLGHGQISLNDAPIVTFKSWSESLKGGGKITHMIGMKGISDGPDVVTISVDNGVPVAGEQYNYRLIVRQSTIITMKVHETATGITASYKGILTGYDRDDGPDAEPSSKITFEGIPI